MEQATHVFPTNKEVESFNIKQIIKIQKQTNKPVYMAFSKSSPDAEKVKDNLGRLSRWVFLMIG